MAGPFADYWIATPNKVLSTTEQDIATIDAPNVVTGMVGLMQVQLSTQNANNLKAVLKLNNKTVFSYGPSDTSMTRMLQAVIPPNTFKVGSNLIEGEVTAGSGLLTVGTIAIFWQAQ